METNAAVLAAPLPRCGVCGHLLQQGNCNRCGGRAEDLRGDPVRPGRTFALFGLVDGIVTMFRAALQVSLMPDFVGRLWVPVLANAVVVAGCGLAAWLLLLPGYQTVLSSRWFALDGLSTSDIDHGALKLTLVTAWLLVPALLAITAGVLMEPLHAATEARLCGPGMRAREPRNFADVVVRGLRLPARTLALAVIALPVLLLVGLVPWAGLPLALLGCGAFAGAMLCEPAAARRGLQPAEFLRLLLHNWPRVIGLGVGFVLCMLVPLLNLLLLMPAGAVASAALYFRFDKAARQG